jgi:hypothetical protein
MQKLLVGLLAVGFSAAVGLILTPNSARVQNRESRRSRNEPRP